MRRLAGAAALASLLVGGGGVARAEEAAVEDHVERAAESAPCRAVGQPWEGSLVGGVRLPDEGPGFRIPATWSKRGLNFGTRELVGAIQHAAGKVAEKLPGSMLFVADLSKQEGGASSWHRSHQNGLDADLIFYAVDEEGVPPPSPGAMDDRKFGKSLRAGKGKWRLDVERQWLLVRTLLLDDTIEVKFIFIAPHIEAALLDHARALGEPDWLVRKADKVMRESGGDHDDHMHLRIGCPADSRSCSVEGGGGVAKANAKAKKKAKQSSKKAAARNGKNKKKTSSPKQQKGRR